MRQFIRQTLTEPSSPFNEADKLPASLEGFTKPLYCDLSSQPKICLNIDDEPLLGGRGRIPDRLPIALVHDVQRRLEQLLQGLLLAAVPG